MCLDINDKEIIVGEWCRHTWKAHDPKLAKVVDCHDADSVEIELFPTNQHLWVYSTTVIMLSQEEVMIHLLEN